ncbi:MAG: endonuclease/exonuclease/phosphatase family protein [Candidatus Komeilibacteria bacterium]|nr:endonuclease/exonuclease/phosphatase family protein [Candidatus Komeilibacteria bacterium]
MKLITLNIWGGSVYKPLLRFIKDKSKSIDIFCFQEVFSTTSKKKKSGQIRADIFQALQKSLPNHIGYFAPSIKGCDMDGSVNFNLSFGLAIFIKKNIKVNKIGEIFVHKHRNAPVNFLGNMARNLLYVVVENMGQEYLIANMHGLWNHGPKTDTSDRIKQSQKARKLLDKFFGKKLICGDFNLLPNTRSVAILDKGMVNLVKKYKVKSTRNRLYRHFKDHPLFADYIIVSPEIKVKDFKVLKNLVSDHSALFTEFN